MATLKARWWNTVGMMYRFIGVRSGRKDPFYSAERAFNRALELSPDFHLARFNRGTLYWRELGNYPRAIDDFNIVLGFFPEALMMRGMAHLGLGHYHEAATDLQHFLEENPQSRWAGNIYSQLYSLQAILDDLNPPLPPKIS